MRPKIRPLTYPHLANPHKHWGYLSSDFIVGTASERLTVSFRGLPYGFICLHFGIPYWSVSLKSGFVIVSSGAKSATVTSLYVVFILICDSFVNRHIAPINYNLACHFRQRLLFHVRVYFGVDIHGGIDICMPHDILNFLNG